MKVLVTDLAHVDLDGLSQARLAKGRKPPKVGDTITAYDTNIGVMAEAIVERLDGDLVFLAVDWLSTVPDGADLEPSRAPVSFGRKTTDVKVKGDIL